jgi:hypothetical protein
VPTTVDDRSFALLGASSLTMLIDFELQNVEFFRAKSNRVKDKGLVCAGTSYFSRGPVRCSSGNGEFSSKSCLIVSAKKTSY